MRLFINHVYISETMVQTRANKWLVDSIYRQWDNGADKRVKVRDIVW